MILPNMRLQGGGVRRGKIIEELSWFKEKVSNFEKDFVIFFLWVCKKFLI